MIWWRNKVKTSVLCVEIAKAWPVTATEPIPSRMRFPAKTFKTTENMFTQVGAAGCIIVQIIITLSSTV